MNLHYMEYFVEAMDQGSISAAAANLFITPQGISQALQRLEREYGTKLFYRENSNICPTKAGIDAYKTFSKIIALNNEMKGSLSSVNHAQSGNKNPPLTIFASPFFTMSVLPSLIPLYCKRNPHIRLKIIEIPSRESFTVTEAGENIIFIYGTTPSTVDSFAQRFPELDERHLLLRTDILGCISPKSPLANKSVLKSSDFADRDIVICRNEEQFLRSLCPDYDPSHIVIRTQSKPLCFSALAVNKNALGFTNRAEQHYCGNKSFAQIPLALHLEIVYGYFVSRDSGVNAAMMSFRDMLETSFRKIPQPTSSPLV